MKKKILVLATLFLLIGCSNEKAESTIDGVSVKKLKVSAMHPKEHPQTQAVYDFADIVNKESGGTLEFDIFPANQLGDYTSVYEEVMKGTIDMALLSVPSSRDSNLEILGFPHLVDSYDQAKKMYSKEGYVHQLVEGILNDHGIELLGLRALGFGGIGSTKEITDHKTPGSKKDTVVRVPQMNSHREYAKAMGFNTVSIPYAEIFSSLQTKAIDGVVGSPPSSNYQNFRDVLKYYYQYNNSFEASSLIINQKFWESLSDKEQEILKRNGATFTVEGIEEAEKNDREYMDKLKEAGVEVIEYTPEEVKVIADYVREHAWPLIKEVEKEHLDNAIKDME